MINLLFKEEKEKNKKERNLKILLIWEVYFIWFSLFFLIFLSLIYIFLFLNFEKTKIVYSEKSKVLEFSYFQEIKEKKENLSQLFPRIFNFLPEENLVENLDFLLKIKPETIDYLELSLNQENQVFLRIFASKRDDLLAWKEKIEKEKKILDFNFPLEALFQKENIDLTVSFKIKK